MSHNTPYLQFCEDCGRPENDHQVRHMFRPRTLGRPPTPVPAPPPASPDDPYRCQKPGCRANAWTMTPAGLECHYCRTPRPAPARPAPTPKDDLEAMFQAGYYADARALYEDALEAARAALPASPQGDKGGA